MQPVDGTGFVPVGQQAAPAASGAQDTTIDAEQGLASLKKISDASEDWGDPVVTSDGRILMPRKPALRDGKIVIDYVLAAKVANGRMMPNPEFLAQVKGNDSEDGVVSKKVVKEGERYFLQTTVQGENGQLVAKLTPMSDAEVQAYAQQVQQQQSQQDMQTWGQDKQDWIQKSYKISGNMRLVSTMGNLVEGLASGPDPLSGKPRASWMTGWFALQMLDSQSGGKLLPAWIKQGKVATTLEWGMQLPFLLSMGDDLKVLGSAFPRAAAVMGAFTAPTRAVINGVTGIGKAAADATMPAAAKQAAMEAAQAAQAAGQTPMTKALTTLGQELRAGQMGYAPGAGVTVAQSTGVMADKVAVMSAQGLQLVPKDAVRQAIKLATPPVTGGAKVQDLMSKGVMGALGGLRPFLQPLAMGASLFGTIGGLMNLQMQVKTQGWKSLVTTQQGRGAALGFLSSASFLGMMMLPAVAPGLGAAAPVVSAGLNVASNVFQAVSSLNYGGLFGDGGYLDHDAVRAAFLIPPLTPIGLFSMVMKNKKKKAEEQQKAEQAKVQQLQSNLQNFRTQAENQLKQAGTVAGASVGKDGTISVVAPFTADGGALDPAAGQPQQQQGGADSGRTLHMLSQRVR